MAGKYWWIVDLEDYPASEVKGRYSSEKEANDMVKILENQYDSLVVVPARNMFEAIEKSPDYCKKGRDWLEGKASSFSDIDSILKLDSKLVYG
jgi:hypothetical protein